MQACLDLISQADNLQSDEVVGLPDPICRAFFYALQEALKYVGQTAPNPPVGCAVLNQKGELLTVAAHHRAGDLHAEALALQQCRALGVWNEISDIVVTFEPCNHKGRTSPCSEALLKTPVKRIWVGTTDPNPDVCGAGNQRLRQGGKKVLLLEELSTPQAQFWAKQCQELAAPFIKAVTKRQAWITVKQALNVSGVMIPPLGQKTFTSQASLRMAHQLRRGTDAIITGPNTIRLDWPSFTVRYVPDFTVRKQKLLVICSQQGKELQDIVPARYLVEAQERGFVPVLCQDVAQLPALLYDHQVIWGMVEGGPRLLQAIQEKRVWDEWLVFRKRVKGEDQVQLTSGHQVSPTRLLLSHAQLFRSSQKEEMACSLVS